MASRTEVDDTDRGPVLVVDDESTIRSILSEFLGLEGYPVATAENGAEALHLIDSVRPSVVLLDMRRPVLDGWEFARRLRQRQVQVPILVMTAAKDAQKWADEIGAQGCLSKPFELEDVLAAVQSVIGDPPN